MTRRGVVAGLGLLAVAPTFAAGWQPTKQVLFFVPAGPGGALDIAARKMKVLLEQTKIINQSLVVENRVGAGGTVAINGILSQSSDGQPLMTFISGMFSTRAIGEAPVSYASLTPVAIYLEESIVVVVRADSPLKNAQDLVAKLKIDPGSLSIGIADQIGNHIHLAIAKPLKVAGVNVGKLNIVPFRSSAESMISLLGGHIDLVSASTPNVVSQLQSGSIRLLAVATADRLPGVLSSVPTWREQGVDATFSSVQGVLGPKDMTADERRFWQDAIAKLSAMPEWKDFLASQYWRPRYLDSDAMTKYLDENYAATRSLLKDLRVAIK
jgi:putative tricarboxylic transport membrane protein